MTHQARYYKFTAQTATFCIAGLIQGLAIENKNISVFPTRLFNVLRRSRRKTRLSKVESPTQSRMFGGTRD